MLIGGPHDAAAGAWAEPWLARFGPYRLQPYPLPPLPPAAAPAPVAPDLAAPGALPPVRRPYRPGREPGGRRAFGPAPRTPGYAPGRRSALALIGALAPFPAGTLATLANAGLGIEAGLQQLGLMSGLLGRRLAPQPGDYAAMATGLGLGAYGRGLGGYGRIGIGGYGGLLDMMDPGVMGPARALAAAFVDARNPAGGRGGHAASRDPQGHGGGGRLGADRGTRFGGPR